MDEDEPTTTNPPMSTSDAPPDTGTTTEWLTPPNRAMKLTSRLPSWRWATARAATFNTTRPSFTADGGTCSPSCWASTRR